MFLSFLIALAGTALVVASAIWLGRLWKGGAHGVAKVLGTAGLLGLIYTGGYTAYLGGRLMAEDGTIAESSRPGDAEAGSLA